MAWPIGVVCYLAAMIVVLLGYLRIRYVLFICVFLSPLIPTAFGYPLVEHSIVVSPTRVIEFILLVGFGMAALTRPGLVRRGFPLTGVLLFYLSVRAAGVVFAAEKTGALIQLFGEAGLFTVVLSYVAFCAVRNVRQFERLITTVLASGLLISLIGLWEWTTRLDFSANVMMPMIGVTADIGRGLQLKAGQIVRVRATLDHPLALAGLMAFLFPFALQRVVARSGAIRVVFAAIAALFAVTLFISFSRIAQLAAVLETLAILYLYSRRASSWFIGVTVAVGAIALGTLYSRAPESDTANSLLVPLYTLELLAGRWLDLGKAFLAHPLALLIGFGFTRFDVPDFRIVDSMKDISLLWSRMDTDILRILALTGVLGFASWIGIFFVFLRRIVRGRRLHTHSVGQAPLLAMGIGVAGCLLTTLPGVSVLTYTQTWPVVAACMGAALGSLPRPNEGLRGRHA
jgi:hypothetical protein